MISTDKNTYFQILEKFEIVPFTQSRGWFGMHSVHKPEQIKFFVNDLENPTIACFAHEKKLLGINFLLIEEESFKDSSAQSAEEIRKFYNGIIKLGYKIIEVASNSKYDFEYEIAMRQAGFLRPVGLFSLPSTKIIDLTKPIEYNKDWKKNIKKAEKFDLFFEKIEKIDESESASFMNIFSEMSKTKSLSIPFNTEMIDSLINDENFNLFFVSKDNVKIAATIVYIQNDSATSIFAASTHEARETSASYFMYDRMLQFLSSKNFKSFDMGKLLPSTKPVNNVFTFKNGIQGEHIQLNGEWGIYKNSMLRAGMYFVKKYLLKKREI